MRIKNFSDKNACETLLCLLDSTDWDMFIEPSADINWRTDVVTRWTLHCQNIAIPEWNAQIYPNSLSKGYRIPSNHFLIGSAKLSEMAIFLNREVCKNELKEKKGTAKMRCKGKIEAQPGLLPSGLRLCAPWTTKDKFSFVPASVWAVNAVHMMMTMFSVFLWHLSLWDAKKSQCCFVLGRHFILY